MPLTVLYLIILLLILLFDIRERRILNSLSLPGTAVALAAGLANGREAFLVSLSGAALGFFFFFALYWIGSKYYGSGALGFGDVKLAMLLGAILGVHQVLIVLTLGMLLAGLGGMLLLMIKRNDKQSSLPYGAYLAFAGIVAIIWTNIQAIPQLGGF
jgi:leader peptidase (prepilin peptidase)/N-methyltransferase